MSATDPLDDLLGALDEAPQGPLVLRTDTRRYGKAVTIVEGAAPAAAADLARALKRALATGGTVKDGHIELQGDVAQRAAQHLRGLGHAVDVEPRRR